LDQDPVKNCPDPQHHLGALTSSPSFLMLEGGADLFSATKQENEKLPHDSGLKSSLLYKPIRPVMGYNISNSLGVILNAKVTVGAHYFLSFAQIPSNIFCVNFKALY
jgi:hypothetical protein